MSNFSDFDALLNDDGDNGSDLVKNLRSALKQVKAQQKADADALAELRKQSRTRTLADVLRDKGVSEKAAKLFPSDTEPTAEAVDSWLGEYGDLFGIEQRTETTATDQQRQAAAQITAATGGAPAQGTSFDVDALVAEIAKASSAEELAAAYERAGLTKSGD